jgi:hypothetical protein
MGLLCTALLAPLHSGAIDLRQIQDIMELQAQIHSLNLINHLYLTKDQSRTLLDLARQNKALEDSSENSLKGIKESYVRALETLRNELLTTPDPRPDVKNVFHTEKSRVEAIRENYEKGIDTLVAGARQALSENQLVIISEYKPCLIPVKNLSDPSRIGQASDHGGAVRLLDKAREMPEKKYNANKTKMLQRLMEKLSRHFESEEIPGLMETVSKTLDEARAMSDADYELKKGDLAKRISPKDMEPRKGKALSNAIAKFLLNPQAIPILERKLAEAK